ncbi:MAG TPA: dienelactone hydrolase family protein [Chloroflexota bacterium]|nr:dienelactone hydrolase family protein [Chloroflexota bacterium]
MADAPTYFNAETSFITFGNRVQGFLAKPTQGKPPFPAVILYHERYGLVQHTLDLAGKFALYGYVCLSPDLFSRWEGDKEALNRGDIQVPISDEDISSYGNDCLDYLKQSSEVDSDRIAVMGVCQSGDYPLVLNSQRHDFAANIVVYGGAQKAVWEVSETRREPYENILQRVTAPILGIWGEDDFVVSVDDMLRLRGALEKYRKTYEFTLFRDMPHGWFNSTMPGRYRPRQTDQAWNIIMDFLERVHAKAFDPNRVVWRFESNIAPDYDFTKKVRLA